MKPRLVTAALILLLGALLLAHQLISLPAARQHEISLVNQLHIVLFAVLTWVVWRLLPHAKLWQIAVTMLVLSAATELVQIGGERAASLRDFIANAIGIAATLAGITLWMRGWSGRKVGVVIGTTLLMVTLALPGAWLLARWHKNQQFPYLFEPAAWSFEPYLFGNSIGVATANHSWPAYQGRFVRRIELGNYRYPGIEFAEPSEDWRAYTAIAVDVFVLGEDPMLFTIGVRHPNQRGTSAYVPTLIQAGANRIEVPLDQLIVNAQGERTLVKHVLLYTQAEFSGRTVLLGDVQLTR